MDEKTARALLDQVARGEVSPEAALDAIRTEPFLKLVEGVTLDPHRGMRTGLGEVVYGRGKTRRQLLACVEGLARRERPVLVTRLTASQGEVLHQAFPAGEFWDQAGLFVLGRSLPLEEPWPERGDVVVVSAGASDLRVALEALGTALFLGADAGLVSDVGVAGIHRLEPHLAALRAAKLLIVVAGMEGALPSVLGGLCGRPIIAVPTSVGYGASFGGLAALLAMLNSCAPGVAVVNIDNGFGAAVMAARLLETCAAPALSGVGHGLLCTSSS